LEPGTNLDGKAFDFERWRLWLEQKSRELLAEGYKTRYGFTDERSKPKTHLDAVSRNSGGYFTNWATGEADFEVLDLESGQRLVDRMGWVLDDANFEAAFEDFRKHLRL
jgi:hypothetical protein